MKIQLISYSVVPWKVETNLLSFLHSVLGVVRVRTVFTWYVLTSLITT